MNEKNYTYDVRFKKGLNQAQMDFECSMHEAKGFIEDYINTSHPVFRKFRNGYAVVWCNNTSMQVKSYKIKK